MNAALHAPRSLRSAMPGWLWLPVSFGTALILFFGLVVRQSVLAGHSYRQAQAMRHEVTWRCKALRTPAEREACLCRARADPPADGAGLRALLAAPAAAAAPCATGTRPGERPAAPQRGGRASQVRPPPGG